jgi:HlyD family secretion protein
MKRRVLIAVLMLVAACHKGGEEEANVVVSVQVAKAERGPIANEIRVVATLVPRREATINPKISAQIAQMPLLVNRPVRAGEVLAVLEARDLVAQQHEAAGAVQEAQSAAKQTNAQDEKALRDARVALENAQRTYDRRKTLFAEGGISKKDLEAAQQAVVNAEDDLRVAEEAASLHHGGPGGSNVSVQQMKVEEARSHLQTLDAQLGYAVIRAPFDGVVTEQWQKQGDFAQPGQKIVTVADTSAFIAKVDVAEETASRVKVGDPVQVLPDALHGEPINGTVSLVGRGADPQSRTVEVWVEVPNPAGRIRANGVAQVVIDAEQVADAVVVPSSAVTLDATNGTAGTVMVVDDKSVAHEVKVTIGIRGSARTQIVSGLNGGETVVTEGNYGLPDGTKVAVAKPEDATPAKTQSGEAE